MTKECKHVKPSELEISYGFARASDWDGLGINYRCPKCHECLWFEDDYGCITSKEKDHNNNKRQENLKWNPNPTTPQRSGESVKCKKCGSIYNVRCGWCVRNGK